MAGPWAASLSTPLPGSPTCVSWVPLSCSRPAQGPHGPVWCGRAFPRGVLAPWGWELGRVPAASPAHLSSSAAVAGPLPACGSGCLLGSPSSHLGPGPVCLGSSLDAGPCSVDTGLCSCAPRPRAGGWQHGTSTRFSGTRPHGPRRRPRKAVTWGWGCSTDVRGGQGRPASAHTEVSGACVLCGRIRRFLPPGRPFSHPRQTVLRQTPIVTTDLKTSDVAETGFLWKCCAACLLAGPAPSACYPVELTFGRGSRVPVFTPRN